MSTISKKLKDYRSARKWNQARMADELGISMRTYQEIEKSGEIKKADIMLKITHFLGEDTQKNVPRGTNQEEEIVIKTDLEKFLGEQLEVTATLQAAVKVLTLKVIELESKATGKSFSQVSLDLESMMKSKTKEISDELSRK